jgi:hypothetical protein
MKMAEPISSSAAGAAGGAMAWKAAGGAAGVAAGAATLAAIVVMCFSYPTSKKEWAIGLICTVVSSLCLGAFGAVYLDLHTSMVEAAISGEKIQVALEFLRFGGVMFVAGLPGWFLVRSMFKFMNKHKNSDILEVAQDVKAVL